MAGPQRPKFIRVLQTDTFASLCVLVMFVAPVLPILIPTPQMATWRYFLWALAVIALILIPLRYLYFVWVFTQGTYTNGYIKRIDCGNCYPTIGVTYAYTLEGKDRERRITMATGSVTADWKPYTYLQIVSPPGFPDHGFIVQRYIPDLRDYLLATPRFSNVLFNDLVVLVSTLITLISLPVMIVIDQMGTEDIALELTSMLVPTVALAVSILRYIQIRRVFAWGIYADATIETMQRWHGQPLIEFDYRYVIKEQEYSNTVLVGIDDIPAHWQAGSTIQVVTPYDVPRRSYVIKRFAPNWMEDAQPEPDVSNSPVIRPALPSVLVRDPLALAAAGSAVLLGLLAWLAADLGITRSWSQMVIWFLLMVTLVLIVLRYVRLRHLFAQGTYAQATIETVNNILQQVLKTVSYAYVIDGQTYETTQLVRDWGLTGAWDVGQRIEVVVHPRIPGRSVVVPVFVPSRRPSYRTIKHRPSLIKVLLSDEFTTTAAMISLLVPLLICSALALGVTSPMLLALLLGMPAIMIVLVLLRYLAIRRTFNKGMYLNASIKSIRDLRRYSLKEIAYTYELHGHTFQDKLTIRKVDIAEDWTVGSMFQVVVAPEKPGINYVVSFLL